MADSTENIELADGAASTALRVEKPGLLTTVQDLGRYGHQRFGVPANGVMDEWSHCVANILVGNPWSLATLECTVMGPALRFDDERLIALAGADLNAQADGVPLPMHRAVLVRAGTTLTFGRRIRGARVYLAIRGGVDTPAVLDSRSTFVRGGFGGLGGRALRKGDALPLRPTKTDDDLGYPELYETSRRVDLPFANGPMFAGAMPWDADALGQTLPQSATSPPVPVTRKVREAAYREYLAAPVHTVRFLAGPQWEAFTEDSRQAFLAQPFCVSTRSDRMGYRLECASEGAGVPLQLTAPLEMISEAVTFGTIQVPPDGQPIVLMADRQGAGGYPKIADVITADLPLLAQAMPGDAVRFQRVSGADAERLYALQQARLHGLANEVGTTLAVVPAIQ